MSVSQHSTSSRVRMGTAYAARPVLSDGRPTATRPRAPFRIGHVRHRVVV